MGNSNNYVTNNGVGFLGLLTIAFIVLKLAGAISWSWWWVLSPIWIPLALVVAIFIIILIVVLVASIFKGQEE